MGLYMTNSKMAFNVPTFAVSSIVFSSLFLFGMLSFVGILQAQENPELQRSSIVVVAQPEFNIQPDQQFSWAENYADISGALKKSEFSVQQLIDEAIIQALKHKGMSVKNDAQKRLLIQYHVSLESEMDDTALAINYGLAPGLRSNNPATRKHERGTLVVDFVDPQLKKVVWRGAIGVFTGIENTEQGRQQRINGLLVELFGYLAAVK